jgi:hypothetical protein
MKPAICKCLLAALLPCLGACATKDVRPSIEREPQEVRCEKGKTPDGPDWPDNWLRDGAAFAIAWLGIATEERRLRAEEHRCIGEHRAKGHIR